MKFGESLSEGLIPEWKDQYLDYKLGKKNIKKLKALGELHSQAFNDKTPLLKQNDNNSNADYVQSEVGSPSMKKTSLPLEQHASPPANALGKSSLFNYSLRSSKNKKPEITAERDKFLSWLDRELSKVDNFYKEKERDIFERFLHIQDQLQKLREHKSKKARLDSGHIHNHVRNIYVLPHNTEAVYNTVNDLAWHTRVLFSYFRTFEWPSLPSNVFLRRLINIGKSDASDISMMTKEDEYDPNLLQNRIRNGRLSFNDLEIDESSLDSQSEADIPDANTYENPTMKRNQKTPKSDYERKKYGVPYFHARRLLKDAVLEHYRSITLLKSYKILNKTGFRKITKKYDKAMNTTISPEYMEKVEKETYFQTSNILEEVGNQVEELYLTFFESGYTDRKSSLEKLKSISFALNNGGIRQSPYYFSVFSSAFFIGFCIPLFVLALYTGLKKTIDGQLPEGRYILQIWGGFLLVNLVFVLFGINMMVFEHFKINYKFIFEFDMRTTINYKQFLVIPSFGMALMSIVMWFSLNNYWPNKFPGREWPWVYFAVMLIIFFYPGNMFFASSRKWLQVALWRILFSGFYPVEFRDFFLGDILCSLTYTMGNISFYFCLYSHHWSNLVLASSNPSANVCTSSKSRSMGFFSALPSIWRFLQCFRRYADTGDWFPHLANMLKYLISTLYYCFLSVYRIERNTKNRVVFITFATVNSLYTSAWDIFMDWSLLQSDSKHRFLRDNLFYKKPLYYYSAIVFDVILRFQWIFYAFFTHQVQQSAVTSYCIAVAELLRRFIWIFFRMENEHSTNVILFRASKDTPLPYSESFKIEMAIKKLVNIKYDSTGAITFNSPLESRGSRISGHSDIDLQSATSNDNVDQSNIDIESYIGLSRANTPTSGASLARRKSRLLSISGAINRAHIKDFQRRKTTVHVEDESEDDDDDYDDDDDDDYGGGDDNRNPSSHEGGSNTAQV